MTIENDNSFAAACYNQNTLEELHGLLGTKADPDDMKAWNISPRAWADQIDEAYRAKRAEAVGQIRDYISGHLKPGINAEVYAEEIMSSAEDMGHINGDDISGEIAGRYTVDGNPNPFVV